MRSIREVQISVQKLWKVWGVIKVLVKYRRVLEDNWRVSGSNDNCQVDNGYCHWSTKQSGMLNITKIKVILIF